MNKKEKKLLTIAGTIFILFFLPFWLTPKLKTYFDEERQSYRKLQADIQRYQRLDEEGRLWKERHAAALQQLEEVEKGLLEGSTREVVAARLQQVLKEHAKKADVQVQSLDLAEFSVTGQWLMVTQEMKFNAPAAAVLKFLDALRGDPLFLETISFELQSALRQARLNGSLKITGFSPVEGIVENNADEARETPRETQEEPAAEEVREVN